MSQVAMTKPNGTRELALQRRKAMSSGGKSAETTAGPNGASATSTSSPAPATNSALANGVSARSASLARRKQMSSKGKSAVHSQDRTRTENSRMENKQNGSKPALNGSSTIESNAELISSSKSESSPSAAKYRARAAIRPQTASNPAKNAALARRKALSTLGKAGLNGGAMTEAQVARAGNPKLSSRELAKVLRDQRSKNGGSGHGKSAPCGRQRNGSNGANGSKKNEVGAAQDAPWKVGASVTVSGQTVTGSMIGRHENMTGDEASTCRAITGTEYLGADIFNKFCQSDTRTNGSKTIGVGTNGSRVNGTKPSSTKKVTVTSTSAGNPVSGNRMGRASNVTGNEPGTCKRITGDEYISAEQAKEFCGVTPSKPRLNGSMAQSMMAQTNKGKLVSGNNVGRSESVTGNEYGMRQRLTGTQYTKPENIGSAPAKVGVSTTLRGSNISGTMVGRGSRVTGDEPGSCRNVTGDDYIGQEQYGNFCNALPSPSDNKVGVSQTLTGLKVTGDLASRSSIVTGNESGTCKAVTGTPYSGGDQYQNFCSNSQAEAARARMQPAARRFARPLTGQQPGIAGLTGSAKGACEPISGTPYLGSDQVAEVCPSIAAEPGSTDYPQLLEAAQWGQFSVSTPNHASHREGPASAVTGSRYEGGHITGPFGMAAGKVTGTEQARFDAKMTSPMALPQLPVTDDMVHGRVKSRITGEGMESGLRITGDDWGRGDHVTGTEGPSAVQRNLSLRGGPMSAMQLRADMARPKDIPEPVSKVTGGSGNTEKGALITYSGGARG